MKIRCAESESDLGRSDRIERLTKSIDQVDFQTAECSTCTERINTKYETCTVSHSRSEGRSIWERSEIQEKREK